MNPLPPGDFSPVDRRGQVEVSDSIRAARAYLLRVAEPPAPALSALVDICGPVEAARKVRSGEVPGQVREETSARRHHELVDADFHAAAAVGARLVIPEDPEWPSHLFEALRRQGTHGRPQSATPPLALWVRGPARLDDILRRAVAITGARASTSYGDHVATDLAYDLNEANVCVVSGAAYGVEGAAHRGALTAAGMTVAVLACGIDVPYPAAHSRMMSQIAERGALVSEYPPALPPAKHRFAARGRLIAAMGAGTVVVEAGLRSGARSVAATTAALGKVVMAVPGPITSIMSAGCHDLLRDSDATLIRSVTDILDAVEARFL